MFIPIKIKIRAAILVIVLLFTFFTFFYFPQKENEYLLKAYNSEIQNLANSVALGIKIALNEDNYEGVETAMEYVKDKPELLFVSLLQTDTTWNDVHTKFTVRQKVFKTFPDSVAVGTPLQSTDSAIIKFAGFNTQLMSGAVALAFSTDEINSNKKNIMHASLLVSASIALLGLIISYLLSQSISKPVTALSKAAQQVGRGDLTPVIKSRANDEIGMLTQAFNTMVAELAKAQHELNSTNETLFSTNRSLNNALNDLKATQAQLVQSEKMASLGELTAGIAHEIQNPLNFVNNFSEVNKELIDELREERCKAGDERNTVIEDEIMKNIEQNLEKINHHGKRADAIVKSMLQHSRQTKGIKEPTDINALCDEYLRLSYHGLRAKDKSFNADFKTEFDDKIGKINIVTQDIGRVLLNLFNNAFYAVEEMQKANASAPKGGQGYFPTVIVTTKKLGDKVEIKVSDNGPGISNNIADKIFQPFFTTKPTGQGTGLGLSLAYDIVKAQGGEISVESRKGGGTAFIVVLPI